jgi:glycosyltransferase involved in cell wall biosynthesis
MRIILATESSFVGSKNNLKSSGFSGVAVFVDQASKYLAESGHKVMIIAPSASNTSKLSVKKISPKLSVALLPSRPNPFRPKSSVASWSGLSAIKGLINDFRPDLIHLQDPAEISVYALRAAKKRGVPVVITNHSYAGFILAYLRFLGPLDKLAEKMVLSHLVRTYNECQVVITPTKSLAVSLRRMGVGVPIRVVSNGVKLEKFHPGSVEPELLTKYGIPKNKKIVLYVGRLDKDKSLETIIDAVPRIVSKEKKAHFVFVGEGSAREEYEALAKKNKAEKHVTWAGYVSHESRDLPKIYRLASVFVMPSLEGQSIATIEAMASGLPIVAADAGGLRELVSNKKNGVRFKIGSSRALVQALLSVLRDKKTAERYGINGRSAAQKYELSSVQRHLVKVYEEVVSRKEE